MHQPRFVNPPPSFTFTHIHTYNVHLNEVFIIQPIEKNNIFHCTTHKK